MITIEKLKEIFARSESRIIDFKSEPHRLDNDHFKSKFIKDIIAMSNSPRDESAYIIIGVKENPDGTKEIVGVQSHPDDNDLQDVLKKGNIEPLPKFLYQSITYEGKSLGVIEIFIDKNGPFYARTGIEVIKANAIYHRLGTQNAEASQPETRNIYDWFNGVTTAQTATNHLSEFIPSSINWSSFQNLCDHFDPDRQYIYIIGPNRSINGALWKPFARLPINLVIDFDPETASEGAFSKVKPLLERQRSIHLLTLGNNNNLVPDRAIYWFAAKGIKESLSTLVENGWREWNQKYYEMLRNFITEYAKMSTSRPVTVVSLWYAPEYVREICSMIDRTFGPLVTYVFAAPEENNMDALADQFSGRFIPISQADVMKSIEISIPETLETEFLDVSLPNFEGGRVNISPVDINWLSEDLEVLHSTIGQEDSKLPDLCKDYLQGHTIQWMSLDNHCDADRSITPSLIKMVTKDLDDRTTSRINLYHWPGAGGTTVARRIAWEFRNQYPVVLLKRIIAKETMDRFRFLYHQTNNATLVIVEGADEIAERIEILFAEARSENIPLVFLAVLRRFEVPELKSGKRTVFLDQALDLPESSRFFNSYKERVPEKERELQQVLDSNRGRTPFSFALTAFSNEFKGLHRYIEARLSESTKVQKQILTFIALSYYYGHRTISAQAFSSIVGIPLNRKLDLSLVLSKVQRELVVEEEKLQWRPIHQLVAEGILGLVLSGTTIDTNNWKYGLANWSNDFIRLCVNSALISNEELIELLRRVFILRDEHEVLGTGLSSGRNFSRLIEDIPTKEGRLTVLKGLTDSFPGESHFWGHRGRFYSFVMKDQKEAIRCIDEAINLSQTDPVLWHMKGMSYREMAYDLMKEMRYETDLSAAGMKTVKSYMADANDSFQKSRELDPSTEHAYISQAQGILQVLDFLNKKSKLKSRSEFISMPNSSWFREQLDQCEDLMDQVRVIREGDRPSRYFTRCEANLEEMYDDYFKALQSWQNLLDRKDVFAPPVRRQIARTYLSRSGRTWAKLPNKEIDRIVDLMEENMIEEPGSGQNIRLWFSALRYSTRHDFDAAIHHLATWRTLGDSIESYYYLYILHVMKAIDGSLIEREQSKDLMRQCKEKAASANLHNRLRAFEWYGEGQDLQRLKNYNDLGDWSEGNDFYENIQLLERQDGIIKEIKKPESGKIELSSCGLQVFFVPARAQVYKGRDENKAVTLYLGFSYDGLRAWDAKLVQPEE